MSSRRFVLSNCSLSYKEWGASNSTKKVLALHGWLDNSNSFNFLGPYLADRGFHVVAYDNIGHGYSSHGTSSSNNYTVASYVGRCRDIVDSLQWEKCNIVGHSLGATLTTIFAGTYPETVQNIALIENFISPMLQPAERARNTLRRAIDAEKLHQLKQSSKSGPKSYDTLQEAIEARMNSVKKYPGKQFLSIEAATALVARYIDCDEDQIACCGDKTLLSTLSNKHVLTT
jgi:pimeloyl-ACP methyl ester carboxylesterase